MPTSKLTLRASSTPADPFSWDALDPSPPAPAATSTLPEAPCAWMSSRDMKLYGARPLANEGGIVRCKDCEKPIQRSAIAEHLGARLPSALVAMAVH
jgi:SAGA-associated factor 73